MGASLLAIAVCQTTLMVNVRPLSRAGSLLQGICAVYVELRRRRVRSNADLFVDDMRRYWASSAPRTQL
ncbi:hypothetical protein CUN61_19480 [Pseudomonas arsenicoxydans]|uniref:Uncharacterized protein n=1 Tax=Pseudomonas arsenicoxydans TaxID=702115 RepID=A0A4P6G8R5_9PSED|nr:hypothetical protein CUN61_19480 [Pseudomonas arsenicoxydans]